jgi:uncharacterized protein YndB with AHSA1/START domain
VASIRTEIVIEAPAEDVWSALRDWGALHERLAPGFVTDTQLDGEERIVTFFTGMVVREVLIDRDDGVRRLAWSVVGGPYEHHNAAAQVFDEGAGRARFVWVADLLPHDLRERTADMMGAGTARIKETLEAR